MAPLSRTLTTNLKCIRATWGAIETANDGGKKKNRAEIFLTTDEHGWTRI